MHTHEDLTKKQFTKYLDACAQSQSNYAIEHLIDGAQLTPERRFRQAVIELKTARFNTATSKYELDKAELDLEAARQKAAIFMHPLVFWLVRISHRLARTKKRADLEVHFKEQNIEEMHRSLLSRRREMEIHLHAVLKYQEELGFTNDTSSDEVYDRIQAAEGEYYTMKLSLDAAAHIVSQQGGPSVGVLLAMQQLPEYDIHKVSDLVKQLANAMNGNEYQPGLHGIEEFKKLINPPKVEESNGVVKISSQRT